MAGMGAGTRRLCVAYDAEQYSQRGTRRGYATQEWLSHVFGFGLKEAGLAPGQYLLQEQGDGGLALLPTSGREALAASSAPLVAVMADGLYCDVLSQGYHWLPGTVFTPVDVQVKTFSARAWIYLPGEPVPPPGANLGTAAGVEGSTDPGAPGGDGQPRAQRFLDSKDAR